MCLFVDKPGRQWWILPHGRGVTCICGGPIPCLPAPVLFVEAAQEDMMRASIKRASIKRGLVHPLVTATIVSYNNIMLLAISFFL